MAALHCIFRNSHISAAQGASMHWMHGDHTSFFFYSPRCTFSLFQTFQPNQIEHRSVETCRIYKKEFHIYTSISNFITSRLGCAPCRVLLPTEMDFEKLELVLADDILDNLGNKRMVKGEVVMTMMIMM
jgi:hypothetical protein